MNVGNVTLLLLVAAVGNVSGCRKNSLGLQLPKQTEVRVAMAPSAPLPRMDGGTLTEQQIRLFVDRGDVPDGAPTLRELLEQAGAGEALHLPVGR